MSVYIDKSDSRMLGRDMLSSTSKKDISSAVESKVLLDGVLLLVAYCFVY